MVRDHACIIRRRIIGVVNPITSKVVGRRALVVTSISLFVGRQHSVYIDVFGVTHIMKSREMSIAGAECVSAPRLMTSTPVEALDATVDSLPRPDASVMARPALRSTAAVRVARSM